MEEAQALLKHQSLEFLDVTRPPISSVSRPLGRCPDFTLSSGGKITRRWKPSGTGRSFKCCSGRKSSVPRRWRTSAGRFGRGVPNQRVWAKRPPGVAASGGRCSKSTRKRPGSRSLESLSCFQPFSDGDHVAVPVEGPVSKVDEERRTETTKHHGSNHAKGDYTGCSDWIGNRVMTSLPSQGQGIYLIKIHQLRFK